MWFSARITYSANILIKHRHKNIFNSKNTWKNYSFVYIPRTQANNIKTEITTTNKQTNKKETGRQKTLSKAQ